MLSDIGNLTTHIPCAPKEGVKTVSYGTAGFRMENGEVLKGVMNAVAIVAGLRLLSYPNTQRHLGMMITASHNPFQDNGCKIVEYNGEMLNATWEKYAESVARAMGDVEELNGVIGGIIEKEGIAIAKECRWIHVGYDTRPSSKELLGIFLETISKFDGIEVVNHGLCSTPLIHYVVAKSLDSPKNSTDYYKDFSESFISLKQSLGISQPLKVIVDASNGVGGLSVLEFSKYLKDHISFVTLNMPNDPTQLNHLCGADFVKTKKDFPINTKKHIEDGECIASLDGDADRLVFSLSRNGNFEIIDGDRIASLYSLFISKRLNGIQNHGLSFSVVQTAYANGNSTKFIETLLPKDSCQDRKKFVPTGVKNLHHEAKNYDISVYFEANGHGTVLFSEKFNETVSRLNSINGLQLYLFSKVINQTVGDAITDLFAVLLALHSEQMNFDELLQLYSEKANTLTKCLVKDRTLLKTSWDETKLEKPESLQKAIDNILQQFPDSRAFVRPSGTENCVRVYCEGRTMKECHQIDQLIHEAIKSANL